MQLTTGIELVEESHIAEEAEDNQFFKAKSGMGMSGHLRNPSLASSTDSSVDLRESNQSLREKLAKLKQPSQPH